MWVDLKVAAVGLGLLVVACGDDDSCAKAREVEDGITKNAEEVDQIPSAGICALDESGIMRRLMDQGSAMYDEPAQAQARAEQYVANCNKLRDLKHECGE